MKKTLLILTGKHRGKVLTIPEKGIVIGRDPQADVRVNSTEVSRLHCEISIRDDQMFVKDLGSRNGTFVNGEVILAETLLAPGATLHIGSMVFELQGKKRSITGNTKPRKPPAARVAKEASDDDVVDWLADEEPFRDSDTTIISNSESGSREVRETSSVMPASESVKIQPVPPGSHAAKAAEIIRQHWQNQR